MLALNGVPFFSLRGEWMLRSTICFNIALHNDCLN